MNWPLLFKLLSFLVGIYNLARMLATIIWAKTLTPGQKIFVNQRAIASLVWWRFVRILVCIVIFYCAS